MRAPCYAGGGKEGFARAVEELRARLKPGTIVEWDAGNDMRPDYRFAPFVRATKVGFVVEGHRSVSWKRFRRVLDAWDIWSRSPPLHRILSIRSDGSISGRLDRTVDGVEALAFFEAAIAWIHDEPPRPDRSET